MHKTEVNSLYKGWASQEVQWVKNPSANGGNTTIIFLKIKSIVLKYSALG